MQTVKTYQPKHSDIKRNWHLVDAKGKVLGRLSTRMATLLMGKHKATYSQHMDMGDFVVVINAKEIVLTGKKMKDKTYKRHSGYPGGFKEVSIVKLMKENPKKVIEYAVSGMLPDNRLKSPRMKRLKIFGGPKHQYENMFKNKK
jgi:large subunit ribosomal protein L13